MGAGNPKPSKRSVVIAVAGEKEERGSTEENGEDRNLVGQRSGEESRAVAPPRARPLVREKTIDLRDLEKLTLLTPEEKAIAFQYGKNTPLEFEIGPEITCNFPNLRLKLDQKTQISVG